MEKIRTIGAWIALTILLFTATVLPVGAVEPVYKASDEYISSPYYTALTEVTLSGDGRYDVLTLAFSQLGYHEGDSDADLAGANENGTRNFAEYNRIYGKLDNGEGNGVSYGYSWCAAFVSWCLRHAEVDKSVALTEVSCRRMTDWYREQGRFYRRNSGYTPRPGDLIMFHEGVGIPTHVGIVVGTRGNVVRVIDGNGVEGSVALHEYRRSSRKIYGYCVPDYHVLPGTVYDFWPEADDVNAFTLQLVMAGVLFGTFAAVGIPLLCRYRRSKERERLEG